MLLSDSEVREEVLTASRRAYLRTPDLQIIERPGWMQVLTPSISRGGNNEVTHADLTEDEADAVIDRTIEQYRAAGVKWRWTVGPSSRPADLAARLERRGFLLHDVAAVARETAGLEPVPGIDVERVDETTIGTFSEVMARGWGIDPVAIGNALAHAIRSPANRHRFYLARIDGAVAGIGQAVWFERSIFLQSGVVMPEHQHRGVYRALVARRLGDAAAAGIPLATSHARPETSAPILERMGFCPIARFGSYSLP